MKEATSSRGMVKKLNMNEFLISMFPATMKLVLSLLFSGLLTTNASE